MGNRILLTVFLAAATFAQSLAASTLAKAPESAEAPPGTFAKVDEVLAEAHRTMRTLEECTKAAAVLRADHAKKQQDLKAEFGTVPPAFNGLLLKKRKRADRQEQSCLALISQPGLLFSQAHNLLRNIEPRGTPGGIGRVKKVEAGRQKYNLLIQKYKGTKQPPTPAPSSAQPSPVE